MTNSSNDGFSWFLDMERFLSLEMSFIVELKVYIYFDWRWALSRTFDSSDME